MPRPAGDSECGVALFFFSDEWGFCWPMTLFLFAQGVGWTELFVYRY